MAVTTFIPTIWEARLLAKFHERSIVNLITTAPTKVEGNKVVFNFVGDVAVNTYAGTVDYEDLTTSSVDLDLTNKKYFAFKVSDVDQVQAAGNLIDPHVSEAAFKLQEATDKFVLDKGMAASTGGTAVTDTADLFAYDIVVKCNTTLNKKKVPKAERSIIVNAEFLEDLVLDKRFTANYTILENGIIEGAKINGVQLIFSEELNGGSWACMVLHKSAIGYAKQIDQIEAMRLQSSFSDGIRGLQLDGAVVLRKDAIAYCKTKVTV